MNKKPAHRPTIYTKELGKEICYKRAMGESLRSICKDPKMPCRKVVQLWLLDEDKKDFSRQYEISSNIGIDELFDEIEEIADNKDGDVQRDRLRLDTRKWYLSKVLPKKFGDKMDLTTGGKPIIQISKEVAEKNNINDSNSGTGDNS